MFYLSSRLDLGMQMILDIEYPNPHDWFAREPRVKTSSNWRDAVRDRHEVIEGPPETFARVIS